MAGVIAKTTLKNVKDLQKKFAEAVGHDIKLYNYGIDEIKEGKVAVLAGGGNEYEIIKDVYERGINTVITGVTKQSDYSQEVHKFEKEKGINLLGGTHYSTEKFACQEMCKYFERLNLPAEFIEDSPMMEDL